MEVFASCGGGGDGGDSGERGNLTRACGKRRRGAETGRGSGGRDVRVVEGVLGSLRVSGDGRNGTALSGGEVGGVV